VRVAGAGLGRGQNCRHLLQVSEVATSEVRAELMRLVDGAAAAPAVSLPAPPPGAGGTRSTSTNIFPSLWYTKV